MTPETRVDGRELKPTGELGSDERLSDEARDQIAAVENPDRPPAEADDSTG